jgi:CRP-like cAMP-binding protein
MNAFECSNQLINHLDEPTRKHILKHSEVLFLSAGVKLSQSGDVNDFVYFPSGCVIALMLHKNEKGLEVCLVGEEGMFGLEAMLGVNHSPYLALVQNQGMVLRVATDQFMKIILRHSAMKQQLHLYTGVIMQQMAQTSFCSHYHLVQARLARLILMFRDRVHSNSLKLTHGVLADMLGVRRVGVTNAAGILQREHILRYARGHIEILDGQALETVACDCYRIDKAIYQLILSR